MNGMGIMGYFLKYKTLFMMIVMAVFGGIFMCFMYINPYGGVISLSELVLQLSGSRGRFALDFNFVELTTFAARMVPAYIFEAYFGIYFYRRFCTASVYVFSRYTGKVRWYLCEAGAIGIYACFFQVLVIGISVLIAAWRFQLQMDSMGFVLMAEHLLLYTLWIYTMSILVNLFAVKIGSSMAFTVVFAFQTIFITMLGVGRYVDTSGIAKKMLAINPMARLVLGWHSNDIKNISLPQSLDTAGFVLGFHTSAGLCAVLCVAVTLAGAVIVKNHDLLVSDSEKGAV